MGRINYMITANNQDFINKMGQVKGEIQQTSNIASKVGGAIGAAFSTAALAGFAKQVVNVRGEIQALETSFKVLAGAKGGPLFEEIRRFAVETPLGMQELAKSAQTLLSFNIEAERVMPLLRQIGDISMGDAQKMQSLTLAFAQMSSTGKLMGQDLLQMINAGFNPLSVIAEQTGKSIGQLKEEMAAGAISAEMIADAFATVTGEGGKFHGMLEQQSKGIKGMVSNLEGAIEDMFNSIGEKSEGIIAGALNVTTELVQNYEKVGKVLMDVVVAYGAYKAAVIALSVAEKVRYQAALAQMAGLTKAQAALNAVQLKNPYVLAGIAVAGLAVGIYKLVTAKTAEEKAVDRANKKWEQWKKHIDDAKGKAAELSSILSSDASTDIQKEEAWQGLIETFPEIERMYTRQAWLAKDLAEQEKILAQIEEQRREAALQASLASAKQRVEAAEAAFGNIAASGASGGGAYIAANNALKAAKADLAVAQKAYDDFLKLKAQAESTGGTTNTTTTNTTTTNTTTTNLIPSNIEEVVKGIVAAEDKLNKARQKFAQSGTGANQKAVETAAKNLADLEAIYKQMTGKSWEHIDTKEITKDFWPKFIKAIEQDAKGKKGIKIKFDAEVDESEISDAFDPELDQYRKRIQAQSEYAREFGTIEEKKAEVVTRYEGEIAQATSDVEVKLLKAKMAAELLGLEMLEMETNARKAQNVAGYVGDIASAFASLGNALGNDTLANVGSTLAGLADTIGGIAGNLATGNIAGAVTAGITGIIDLAISAVENYYAKLEEGAQLIQEEADRYNDYFQQVIDGATSATQALKAYNDAIAEGDRLANKARGVLANKGYTKLSKMSGEELQKWIRENMAEYNDLPEYVKTHIDTIINSEATAQELKDQLQEKLTGITFESVKDNMAQALLDGTKSVTDNVQDMMRTAIAKGVSDAFDEDWAEWYNDFAAAMEGGLSEAEAADLQAAAQLIFEAQKQMNDAALGAAGIASEARSAKASAVTQASQDSIDYMNGQLTLGNHTLLSIDSRLLDAGATLTKLLQGNSVVLAHLSNIAKNTDSLPTMAEEVALMRSLLDSIKLHGLKMKA